MPAITAPEVRFEHRPWGEPALGLGTGTPRLSWRVAGAPEGYVQSRVEVELTRMPWGGTETVQTTQVSGAAQSLVAWPFEPLGARERGVVRIRVAGDGEWSDWSQPAAVEAGLLTPGDWSGARFATPIGVGGIGEPAPALTNVVAVAGRVAKARLYVTAHGWYEVQINGRKVGDGYFGPGWTAYDKRLRYYAYDVTELLHEGDNDIAILLGNGWYRGRLTWGNRRALYGDKLAALLRLDVLTDKGQTSLVTDDSWRARSTNILADDMYDGETVDFRLPLLGAESHPVAFVERDLKTLVAAEGPEVRVTDVLPAVKVWRSPSGKLLVDFGQNVVGFPRIKVRGLAAGTSVVVRQAEVLEHDELGVRPLRSAKATDTYITSGAAEEVLEPRFTFHGFRYAEIEGAGDVRAADVEAVVTGSAMQRTGWFECSDDLLTRFHENVVWGMRGNFVDVPTDCPQRDERLGWTGDIQVFSPTAQYLFDSTGFLSSWLRDVEADQKADGAVPFVVPDVLGNGMASAAWGDAACVVPWVLYERSGDASVLATQLNSMRRWVEYLDAKAGPDGVWAGGFHFGDWLDPTAPPEEPARAKADPDVIATAHVYLSARNLAWAAEVVGDADAASYGHRVADRALAGFRREYVTAGGRVLSDAQTVYAMALVWGLLETEEQRQRAADRLADLVRGAGFRIATGFVGTPLVTDALARYGHLDTAYRLALQTGNPSWLYSVTMGATTVWERWDSMLPDGTINPGEMTSFNHYALGALADWLHRSVAGLAPLEPGYRKIRIAPRPGGGLTHASTRHISAYGENRVAWQVQGRELVVSANVPVGAKAVVSLPGKDDFEVAHGSYEWRVPTPAPAARKIATVRELMDDRAVWSAFVDGAIKSGVRGMVNLVDEPSIAHHVAPYLDEPVDGLPLLLSMGNMDSGTEALRKALAAAVAAS